MPWLIPSLIGSLDHAVVCSRPSGPKRDRAVEPVKSFEFEARIRMRPPLREKRTLWLLGSNTKAPLLPTLRKSLASPVASFPRDTDAWAAAAPCAIGVLNALSGFGRA